jgi:hypothetical protein
MTGCSYRNRADRLKFIGRPPGFASGEFTTADSFCAKGCHQSGSCNFLIFP